MSAVLLAEVRERRPLVHNITNLVVQNFTANILLAVGASPVMAHAPEEVEEMARAANSLVLNIGTLDESQLKSMALAAAAACDEGRPVILDPVGAGATKMRTQAALSLLERFRVAVVRCNPGEAASLLGQSGHTRGVESRTSGDQMQLARELARRFRVTAAVTGPEDAVCGSDSAFVVRNGHPLLQRVTGTGCAATAVVAAFCAAASPEQRTLAVAGALAYFGLAAERAASRAGSPGSFAVALLDELAAIQPQDLEAGAKVTAE